MRKADIALPRALENIIHGYGQRSLKCPIKICPITPEELKMDKTIVAESGDEIDLVNTAIYKDTGKYESACKIVVVHYFDLGTADSFRKC